MLFPGSYLMKRPSFNESFLKRQHRFPLKSTIPIVLQICLNFSVNKSDCTSDTS